MIDTLKFIGEILNVLLTSCYLSFMFLLSPCELVSELGNLIVKPCHLLILHVKLFVELRDLQVLELDRILDLLLHLVDLLGLERAQRRLHLFLLLLQLVLVNDDLRLQLNVLLLLHGHGLCELSLKKTIVRDYLLFLRQHTCALSLGSSCFL